MNQASDKPRPWWGEYTLASGRMAAWRIGPLHLNLYRLALEWQLAFASLGERRDETVEIEPDLAASPVPEHMELVRYVYRDPGTGFSLQPVLADRPVVVKPVSPLYVPPGERVTLYVGSPVNVQVILPGITHEVTAYRSSDTWFGPNTREGELCYASSTLAQLRLEDCTIRPHRAITSVEVRNDGDDPLLIEQLRLPAPYLALYATGNGILWTQSILLTRTGGALQAKLELGDAAAAGGAPERLAEPRMPLEKNIMVQAFNRLFN